MNDMARVLVVEDDHTLRDALCDTIEFGGYRALPAENGLEALSRLEGAGVDMVISDVRMDGLDGHGLLREVRARRPDLPFVMMTAHGSIRDAVTAMRDGATDYLLKPFEAQVLLDMVARMEPQASDDGGMIAGDPSMREVCALADRIAPSDGTVLISGESGTGKEVLARYIHRNSPRADKPFLAVNCAAIPENMLESMLFGYEKGAYTGAHQSRAGKFEQANGGTLLLDEISEMDLALQAKLLRVLQEREVERLGGSRLIALDVRVIATTNRRLEECVQDGRFREDLYYRLKVLPMRLPALRERPADIPVLAETFLARYRSRPDLHLGSNAHAALLGHHWPGNVRELENCIQRAAILARGVEVGAGDLALESADLPATAVAPAAAPVLEGDLRQREAELILRALEACGGSRKEAAARLGISPRTLRYKLARLREQGQAVPASRSDQGGAAGDTALRRQGCVPGPGGDRRGESRLDEEGTGQ